MTPATALERKTAAIVRGRHRFTDPELARIAAERGDESAWRAGFERHGRDVVHKVEGDFAVYLEDARGRRFSAVDRFAIHPLCYRMDGDGLHVGERADTVAGAGSDLDPQAIFDYLFFHVIPAPRTIFQWRVAPARRALRAGGEREADGHALVESRLRRECPGRLRRASRRVQRSAARMRDPPVRQSARRLFPQWRHRQLDRGRHRHRAHGPACAHLLDRLRCGGLRRNGVRAHCRETFRDGPSRVLRHRRRHRSQHRRSRRELRPAFRQLVGAPFVLLRAEWRAKGASS